MAKKKPGAIEHPAPSIEERLVFIEGILGRFSWPHLPVWFMDLRGEKALSHLLTTLDEREFPVEGWNHLVARPHPWKRQLYLKGRNMTARQLVGSIKADKLTINKAADNWDLPVGAIEEALRYAVENVELLEMESAIERYIASQGVKRRAPQPVT